MSKEPRDPAAAEGDWIGYSELVDCAEERPVAETTADHGAILHFTSGSTGRPKGALLTHGAVVGHEATGRNVLGLRDDDEGDEGDEGDEAEDHR